MVEWNSANELVYYSLRTSLSSQRNAAKYCTLRNIANMSFIQVYRVRPAATSSSTQIQCFKLLIVSKQTLSKNPRPPPGPWRTNPQARSPRGPPRLAKSAIVEGLARKDVRSKATCRKDSNEETHSRPGREERQICGTLRAFFGYTLTQLFAWSVAGH